MDDTHTPTKDAALVVKLFSWPPNTIDDLKTCKEFGRHASDTETVKAALVSYRAYLEIEAARAKRLP